MIPRTRTILRNAAFAVVALITLSVLAGSWISFTGRKEWAATKAGLLARGEKLSFAELAPGPLPDEQNFFAHPMWEELADTVVSTTDHGVSFREPRLPEGSRILDRLNAPPSPGMESKANSLFGLVASNNMLRAAEVALREEPDPHRRQEIARWILDYLEPARPLLDDLRALAARPGARFSANAHVYELPFTQYYTYLLRAAQTFSARAKADLALDRPAEALADIDAVIGILTALRSEPTLMATLVDASISTSLVATIRQGIEWHAWRETDLQAIQSRLSAVDVLGHLAFAIRGLRGTLNEFFEALHSEDADVPEAFRHQVTAVRQQPRIESDLAVRTRLNLLLQHYIDALESRGELGLKPEAFAGTLEASGMLGALVAPGVEQLRNDIPRLAAAQEAVGQTKIACAIERFRIANGNYPKSLEELVPRLLPEVPRDIVSLEPMRYRAEGSGFTVWSAGWDGVDGGGEPGRKNRRDWATGDWVWGKFPGAQPRK